MGGGHISLQGTVHELRHAVHLSERVRRLNVSILNVIRKSILSFFFIRTGVLLVLQPPQPVAGAPQAAGQVFNLPAIQMGMQFPEAVVIALGLNQQPEEQKAHNLGDFLDEDQQLDVENELNMLLNDLLDGDQFYNPPDPNLLDDE